MNVSATFSYTQLLKISDPIALNNFLHECVDDLLQKRVANFENYKNVEWIEEDFDKSRTYIQNIYKQSVIENNLELPKDLTTGVQEAIARCYKVRRNDIFQFLATECLLQNSHNLVNNIDWRLKWILGTSDLAALQEPQIQVDLHCKRKNGSNVIKNTINFEANLHQIDKLISELSKCEKEFQ